SVHRHMAGDFGTGQRRPRVMFVFERDPRWWPSHPVKGPATVWEAISDLYDVPPNEDGSPVRYAGPPKSEYQALLRGDGWPGGVRVAGAYGEWPEGAVQVGNSGFTSNHAFIAVPEHHERVPQGESWLGLPDEDLTEKEVLRRK